MERERERETEREREREREREKAVGNACLLCLDILYLLQPVWNGTLYRARHISTHQDGLEMVQILSIRLIYLKYKGVILYCGSIGSFYWNHKNPCSNTPTSNNSNANTYHNKWVNPFVNALGVYSTRAECV